MKNVTFKTRHALVLSCISLMTCFAMLLGTTFAWFTDSVTSGVNRIVAGNLDVELYHKNTNTTTVDPGDKVDNVTTLFNAAADDNGKLWEPGAVAYETFTIKNVGNLALKYQLSLVNGGNNTVKDTTYSLLDVIKVGVIEDGATITTRDALIGAVNTWNTLGEFIGNTASTSGNLDPAGGTTDSKTFTVVLYWPSDTDVLSALYNVAGRSDNDYNLNNDKEASDGSGELYVNLGAYLLAGQYQQELDSFDNTYDAGSSYPAVTGMVSTATSTPVTLTKTGTETVNSATVSTTTTPLGTGKTTVKLTESGTGSALADENSATEGNTISKDVTLETTTTDTLASSATYEVDNTAGTAVASVDLTLTVTKTEKDSQGQVVGDPVTNTVTSGFTAEVETYIAKNLAYPVTIKYGTTETWAANDNESELTLPSGENNGVAKYDSTTGKLTFKTSHFSDYVVYSDIGVLNATTNAAYPTLSAAVEAAQDGGSIILLKDVDLVAIDKNVKVVGNGTTVVDTKNVVTSTIQTLKNVTFENIVFKSTSGWTMNNSSGVDWTGIFSTNTTLDNVTFKNCTFSTRNDNKTNCIYNATINNGATFDGCTIYGDTYGINFAYVNGTLTLKNCDISGWNSFGSGTNSKVVIENSTFHKSIYNKLRFYQNADVTNCTFDSKFLESDMSGEIYNYGEFKAGIDVNANDVTVKLTNCSVKDASAGTQANLTEAYTKTCDGKTGVTFTISSVSTPDSE